MNELALFSGAGGGILGGHLLGWRTVCAVEWMPYPRSILMQRQDDGILRPFPIWDDVQTFDGRPWAGCVDVVSGGFPCQDISAAGKGAGIDGERSGMWSHMARIIGEVRPRFAFVENSPILTSRGLGRVLGDLAAMGYDAEWCVLGDAMSGRIKRDRLWVLACSNEVRRDAPWNEAPLGSEEHSWWAPGATISVPDIAGYSIPSFPADCGMDDRLAPKVDIAGRLECCGNGQVPVVAASAFRILSSRLGAVA